ncbi:MAG TPA: hypothetical protein DDW20_00810 [Firmicutes bacterium]|nr:hypothetical protein [Bacillota bacterium]
MDIFAINNLTHVFQNGDKENIVLKNLSLKFSKNSFVAIYGKSGCGKSTLLNCLNGIIKPSSGSVKYFGKDINEFSKKEKNLYLNQEVSMVFQHYNLFDDLSSIDNAIIPLLIRGEKKKKCYRKAFFLFKNFNLENCINKKAKFLSGGEKQRVSIIRALLSNSKVILCDEPTGALDEQNSILIMDILKELSKQKLIIFVSHNLEFVNRYADRIIELSDGNIVKDKIVNNVDSKTNIFKNKRELKKQNVVTLFIKKLLRNNFGKNSLVFIISTFGFLIVLLSISFINGNDLNKENVIFKNIDSFNATLSSKIYKEIPNSSLVLEKDSLPNEDEIKNIKDIFPLSYVCDNYDYFIPTYSTFSINNTLFNNIQFIPFYENNPLIEKDLIKSLNDVVINEEMSKLLKSENDEIIVFNQSEIKYHTYNKNMPFVKDDFGFNLKLNVKKTIKEFSFLNGPKVYYSYNLFEEYLKKTSLVNISEYLKKDTNVVDYLNFYCKDEAIRSYSKRVFFSSNQDIQNAFSFIKNNKTDTYINSGSYEIKKVYVQYIDSFSNAFLFFSILCFVCLNLVIGITSLSNYIEKKKENAILKSFGLGDNSIRKIYTTSNIMIIFLSYILSFCLFFPISYLLNKIIYVNFNLENLIITPFKSENFFMICSPILLLVIGLFISYVFVYVPLLASRKIDIAKELKDE